MTYGDADKSGRLRSRKVCGVYHDIPMTATMLENLRSVYLQPLRDAELGLRPNRMPEIIKGIEFIDGIKQIQAAA